MTIKEIYEEAKKRGKEDYEIVAYTRYGSPELVEEPDWEWDEMAEHIMVEGGF